MKKIVSIVITNKEESILLLKRNPHRKSYPKKWCTVSGIIEKKESPEECALREVKEELGKDGKFTLIRQGEPFLDKQAEGEWQVYPFLFKYNSGAITLNNENTQYTWVDLDQLGKFDIVPGVYDDLKGLNIIR